ncbi:L-rhamnose mutarotase [Micromonospora sp. DR5-3]|uniref:L-rhamnose mutarotase n=1 Tax=unclassified Micromonospora TaxID=2617518 RepID=UPI0011DC2535|nr:MULTISPECIES: L-rhamnose mutarotase [unclassified Micromonospora]MCW3818157.1 L-rhamnose mutarotase [Micromonospora sp. DR5-3]TYC21351.1 L-rhamnose mutarotase [Micromonospora sp. MP36]
MPRICFTLQVDPARLDEYRARHERVWPEVLAALADSGWRDYSLFLREDGLVVGFLVTDDFAAAQAAMQARDVNARWQAEMASFFLDLDQGTADRSMRPLVEVFHLEAQLAAQTGDSR